ncbi:Protein of unknown function (DUF2752) [Frankia sp. EI5c]|uniref:DUF2752 domain-containing protein n=1 Tax=Frankia sp. EI5c TaxID=683316 RepID=UPI0007C30BFF|nr:DUF2752 domain-containing protein [Frankia sp. EI5c]OAA28537.1 Protein of unknown function (DUF2752) [Frankia sp. EI5c]
MGAHCGTDQAAAPAGAQPRRGPARGTRRQRRALLAAGGSCLLAGIGYLAVVDPHDPAAVMPLCPVRAVTGLDCPACGGLRLTHDLLRGLPAAAARDNLFLLVCAPLLVGLALRQARAFERGGRAPVPRRLAYGLAAAALLWTVVRNLPWWPLRPASG